MRKSANDRTDRPARQQDEATEEDYRRSDRRQGTTRGLFIPQGHTHEEINNDFPCSPQLLRLPRGHTHEEIDLMSFGLTISSRRSES
jgi:hypothetical protein